MWVNDEVISDKMVFILYTWKQSKLLATSWGGFQKLYSRILDTTKSLFSMKKTKILVELWKLSCLMDYKISDFRFH